MSWLNNPIKTIAAIASGNDGNVVELVNTLVEEHLENKKSSVITRVPVMNSYVETDEDFNKESESAMRVLVADTFDLCLTKKDSVVDLYFEFELREYVPVSKNEKLFDINEFFKEASKGHRYMMEYLSCVEIDKLHPVTYIMSDKSYVIPGCVINGEWPQVSAGIIFEFKEKPSLEGINKEISQTLATAGVRNNAVKKSSEDFTLGDHIKIKAVISVTNIYSQRIKPLSLE